VRNKNLLLVLMFLFAMGMFAYDGFHGYPHKNDLTVDHMLKVMIPANQLDASLKPQLEAWPGWDAATPELRDKMYGLTRANNVDGFHSALDIQIQQIIAVGLTLIAAAAVWWFFHCQRRRVTADDAALSPAPGVTIPWGKIKTVDNSFWNKKGLVYITYTDDAGEERQAKLDDYVVDRTPLIEILNRVEARAVNAEFLPKAAPATPAGESS
jgi:hypothetical protein